MMRKNILLTGTLALALVFAACSGVRREEGRVYMPDMAYSRAYETYASTAALQEAGVHYNARPVEGTVARGAMVAYPFANDSVGYVRSAEVKSPLDVAAIDMTEAERIYLINCGICHGANLNGNGPLYKDGNGPYPAKPATLVGDAKYENMPAGQMFYSVAYGKNLMGSYASQLSRHQRWMIIKYIKNKQAAAKAAK